MDAELEEFVAWHAPAAPPNYFRHRASGADHTRAPLVPPPHPLFGEVMTAMLAAVGRPVSAEDAAAALGEVALRAPPGATREELLRAMDTIDARSPEAFCAHFSIRVREIVNSQPFGSVERVASLGGVVAAMHLARRLERSRPK